MSTPRTLSDVAAANLRDTRVRRGLSTRGLSAKLEQDHGVSLSPGAVLRLEHEDPSKRRRMDVDDLGHLSAALNTSPAFLVSPDENDVEPLAVTPKVEVAGGWVERWARGVSPLPGGPHDDYEERQRQFLDAAPESSRYEVRVAHHPAVVAISGLEAYLYMALTTARRAEGVTGPMVAEQLRENVGRVARYVELLAEEVESEGGA